MAHSVLPVPAAKLPSLHTAQEVAPGEAEALPAAQGVHVAELAVEKEPAAHCVQPAAPAPAAPVTTPAKPAPQTLHEVAPAPGVEKPGLQTRHVFAFVAFTVVLKVPTAQEEQPVGYRAPVARGDLVGGDGRIERHAAAYRCARASDRGVGKSKKESSFSEEKEAKRLLSLCARVIPQAK